MLITSLGDQCNIHSNVPYLPVSILCPITLTTLLQSPCSSTFLSRELCQLASASIVAVRVRLLLFKCNNKQKVGIFLIGSNRMSMCEAQISLTADPIWFRYTVKLLEEGLSYFGEGYPWPEKKYPTHKNIFLLKCLGDLHHP